MKIIQIMDSFVVSGGVNSFVYDLCFALKDAGYSVSLIGILSEGINENPVISELKNRGIQVECVGASSKKDALIHHFLTLRKYIKKISKGEETICNLHLKLSVLMGVLSTRGLTNVKCIETYHNTYHHYHLQCWVLHPFIKRYICVSETARQEMHRRFHISYKELVAIPNGVSRNQIRKIAEIEENFKSSGKLLRVISVGRLSYEKNFLIPVTAFAEMCHENISYTIVGGGPQEKEILSIAKKNPNIKLLGAQSRERTLKELGKSDLCIISSLWEGRSILQLEAMALDKPLILSDVPGLREIFGEPALKKDELFRVCKFGYLVRTNEICAYQEAVRHFLNKGDSRTIKGFIQKISEENDISITAKKYIDQYIKILGEHINL